MLLFPIINVKVWKGAPKKKFFFLNQTHFHLCQEFKQRPEVEPIDSHSSKYKVKQWSWLELCGSVVWPSVPHKLRCCKQLFSGCPCSLVESRWGNGESEHHFLPCSPSACWSPSAPVSDAAGITHHQSAQGRPDDGGGSIKLLMTLYYCNVIYYHSLILRLMYIYIFC